MKLLSLMPAAETTRPAVSTCEPLVKMTPDWLMSTTWPFARMRPPICEGSPPSTRFSAMALAPGWLNCTVCALPTLKLCQLRAARWLCWLIVVVVGPAVIVAWPALTAPPVGRAFGASWAWAGMANATSAVVRNKHFPV